MKYKGHDYDGELDVAIRAARKAGELIERYAGNVDEENVRHKGLNDIVTEIDEAAQELIIRTLEASFPGYVYLAEEGPNGSTGDPDRPRWIIDPIDGTTNFTRGAPPYAVSIGLEQDGEMVVGVILDVSRNELFSAVRGHGLYVDGQRRRVSPTERLADSLVTTGFPYRVVEHLDLYLEVLREFILRTRGLRRPGSAAVDMAYVACGRYDGFFETGLFAWDVAAGLVLVEEGGGRVTDFRNDGNPLFSEQVLATNGRIHAEMLQVVARMQEVSL